MASYSGAVADTEVFDDGEALWEAVCAHEREGVVVKPRRSRYLPSERGWLKVKNRAYSRWELEYRVVPSPATDRRGRSITAQGGGDRGRRRSLLAERRVDAVIYSGWLAIDEVERAAGEKLGRPRVKLRTWDELLQAAERVTEKTA